MRNRKIFVMILAVGFLCGLPTCAYSDTAGIDPRDIALDKTLGGMAEGSRILSPHGDIHAGGQRQHGTPEHHIGSAVETPHPLVSATAPGPSLATTEANHGIFVQGSGGREAGSASGPHEGIGANIGIETGGGHATVQETPSGSTGGSPGGNLEGSTGGGAATGGEHSVIEIIADANLETDIPTAGGEGTIDQNAGGGLLDVTTETTTNTGGQEAPSGTSGTDRSVIEAGAGVDVSGGSPAVETEVAIDPNASGGLVDAEAAASTDIIEQELTSEAGLQVDTGTDTTASETTTVGTETGSTNAPATNEVTGGAEADVDGIGAGDDVECNEAEGLSCPTPKL